jgi:hypothetical protein
MLLVFLELHEIKWLAGDETLQCLRRLNGEEEQFGCG